MPRKDGRRTMSVSVNVSPRQFELGDIVQTVADALRLSGLAPTRLKLEITESVFISKESSNLYMMNELQNLGLSLVLDDFGTGYSSLSYLDTFRFDLVKIDRSFIAKSTDAEETQPLLEAIIGITSALKLPVTAEGVETQEQFERVRKLGCQYAQGYLFGRPGTEAAFLQRLQAWWIGKGRFLKKSGKKILLTWARGARNATAQINKVFCCFFHKKRPLSSNLLPGQRTAILVFDHRGSQRSSSPS